ncbi:related to YJU2 - Essential nuclear protein, putative spliceosomal component [Cephalotrichum gorgonifer]|uniref:Splicing factor YJU2 n=1 Tax=Cephalotrichum gorgonifer TaxID=2041049 RepID=A0AAE8MPD7_9PEZI|nr:related to YJU2 - Essential nuclear protein, putative spliceosomal component [Cephalotrichum gorgonifer]
MAERKVLTKYYPADFDPSELVRKRKPKDSGPKIQPVRLMAPFSMRCTSCGEFIGRGRKFNARKETPLDEKYLGIQIVRLHIRCTRCSSEIIFRTDPKNNDYSMVKGAVRNMEPWRDRVAEDETDEQRLDRLEREEAEAAGEEEKDAMAELEAKNADAKKDMAAADALDAIRQRNARIQIAQKEGVDFVGSVVRSGDEERERQEREDEEAARRAFAKARGEAGTDLLDQLGIEELPLTADGDDSTAGLPTPTSSGASGSATPSEALPAPPSFKRVVKRKRDHAAALGIKKKKPLV